MVYNFVIKNSLPNHSFMLKKLKFVIFFLGLCLPIISCFYSYKGTKDANYRAPATAKDLLPHHKNSLEWWYFSSHLNDTAGNKYGVMFTVFKKYIPIMGHGLMINYTVTNEKTKTFYKWHGFKAIKKNKLKDSLFNLSQKTKKVKWVMQHLPNQQMVLNVNIKNKKIPALQATLTPIKKLIAEADSGYMQYQNMGKAGYLSYTRMATTAKLIFNKNPPIACQGNTWFDKQWNCGSIVKKHASWNWLGIQLANGEELMLFSTYNKKTKTTQTQGTIILQNSNTIYLNNNHILLAPSQYYKAPSGRMYPTLWAFNIPSQNITATVKPLFNNHELSLKLFGKSFMNYWEGKCEVNLIKNGVAIKGEAFLEMTNPK